MRNKYVIILLCLIASLVFMFLNPYKIIVVRGNSMYPTLKNGQVLLAKKYSQLNKGDIVIAKNDFEEVIIKRILYVPGEYYYFFYNLESQDSLYELLYDNSYKSISNFKTEHLNQSLIESKVPIGHYYLTGDNKDNSDDSRRFGTVEKKDILYKVIR